MASKQENKQGGKKEQKKSETKATKETKAEEKNENFQYIVRIAGKDLDGERSIELALADLKGIGQRLAQIITRRLEIDGKKKIGDLPEEETEKIREYVESKSYEGVPVWAMNHRNEVVSGDDFNLVSNDLDIMIQDDINYMKKMKSYRGMRHEMGKKVRGQRTRSNGRKGLTVGVQRKKE